MNTTKNTPGPWNISSANRYAVNARRRGIATAHGTFLRHIATAHGTDNVNYSDFFPPTEEAAANARLIAAAPDLLSALEDAEFLLRKAANLAGPMQDSFMRSAEDARAAIAKATKP